MELDLEEYDLTGDTHGHKVGTQSSVGHCKTLAKVLKDCKSIGMIETSAHLLVCWLSRLKQ